MNASMILNKVQERIALDNFKIENVRKRKTKRVLIAASAATVVFAGVLTINAYKKRHQ